MFKHPWIVVGAVVLLFLFIGGLVYQSYQKGYQDGQRDERLDQVRRAMDQFQQGKPGGLWVSPSDRQTIAGTISFRARAYPTNVKDPAIDFVLFTVSWEGRPGPWIIACKVEKPVLRDEYECNWTPDVDMPEGKLNISFDVYDVANRRNLAPHGTRSITWRRQ